MKKTIINILKTIAVSFALFVNIESVYKIDFKNMFNIQIVQLAIMIVLIYYVLKKDNNKKYLSIKILSCLFSLFFVIGESYRLTNSIKYVLGNYLSIISSIIIFIGYYIIFSFILYKIYKFLSNYKPNNNIKKNNKIIELFKKYPFIFSLIVILFGWLIYIIAFYPAILSPDPSFQIKQFFGIQTKYMNYIIPIDSSVTITNHHPVFHTIILGGLVKIGEFLGNTNFGFFLYSLLQIIILSTTLAYTIKFMIKLNTPIKFVILTLIIYTFTPVYALYSISAVKDVIFTSFIILFNIYVFNICTSSDKMNISKIIQFTILMILIILFRNNGIYVILITLLSLIITNIKNRKLFIILLLLMFGFNYSYNKILLPYFKISPGSVREALSIPFQQTARYVKYNSDLLSKDEEKAIDKVLNIETLADRYKPEISDPVKNEYNKYATTNDLKNYFSSWFKGLLKSPGTYIEATLNNTYGYFYPNKTRWYVYYDYYNILDSDGIEYHYNKLSNLRKILSNYAVIFPYIPLIGLIVNIGFNTLLLIFITTYLIAKKKNIIFLIPSLVSLLVCFASPVNAYFRYAMPYIFSMQVLISMFLYTINTNNK